MITVVGVGKEENSVSGTSLGQAWDEVKPVLWTRCALALEAP